MTTVKTDITSLIEKYFDQQRQIYGDGYILTRQELETLVTALRCSGERAKPSSQSVPTMPVISDLPKEPATALKQFYQQIKNCQNCPLGSKRKNFVFGVGNPQAKLC